MIIRRQRPAEAHKNMSSNNVTGGLGMGTPESWFVAKKEVFHSRLDSERLLIQVRQSKSIIISEHVMGV